MKFELQGKVDHAGVKSYWIYKDGYAEIPIYHDKDKAETVYNQMIEFYRNPPLPVILKRDTI